MFYVGQKVVAVETVIKGGIHKGQIYTITGVTNCTQCGMQHVTYGVDSGINLGLNWCTKCGNTWKSTLGSEWCVDYKTFAPLEEYTDNMSIAMQLVQELDQVDKAKNPIKTPQKA